LTVSGIRVRQRPYAPEVKARKTVALMDSRCAVAVARMNPVTGALNDWRP
jgi:hypothetical protein